MISNQNRFGRRGFTSNSPSSTSVANYGNSAMSRGTFMRGLGLAGAGVAAGMMGLSGVARAQAVEPYTVTATGVSPTDASNVQAAVDNPNYNPVYLAPGPNGEPFNFGTYDSVRIKTKDVEIIGLGNDAAGDPLTIINGGISSISCYILPEENYNKVNLKVRNIHLDGALYEAIFIWHSSGAEITGCKITNVIAYESFSCPILVMGIYGGDITGNILIQGNNIDPGVDNYAQQNGIFLWGTNATATITGNTVRNFSGIGIFCDNNQGFTTISNNKVYMDTGGGYGIKVGEYSCGIIHGIYQGSAIVTGNEIHSAYPWADGICLDGGHQLDDAVFIVSHNYVNMTNTYGGVRCDGVHNSIWESNTIAGNMHYAIWVAELDVVVRGVPYNFPALNNVFKGNNVNAANNDWATAILYYGANYNTLIGNFNKSVYDIGIGNYITGYTKKPFGPQVGQAIKDALARKHALMKPTSQ